MFIFYFKLVLFLSLFFPLVNGVSYFNISTSVCEDGSFLCDLDGGPFISYNIPNNTILPYNTTDIIFSIETSEKLSCKYDSRPNLFYSLLNFSFGSLDGLSHTSRFSVSEGESYVIYVTCQDEMNNLFQKDYSFNFKVDKDPANIVSSFFVDILDISTIVSQNVSENNIVIEINTKEVSFCKLSDSLKESHINFTLANFTSVNEGRVQKAVIYRNDLSSSEEINLYVSCISNNSFAQFNTIAEFNLILNKTLEPINTSFGEINSTYEENKFSSKNILIGSGISIFYVLVFLFFLL